jgi:hypothetical protein
MGRGRGFTSAIVMLALGDFVWACSSLALSALLLFASSSFSLSACQALRQLFQVPSLLSFVCALTRSSFFLFLFWSLFQVGSWSSLAWSLCILVLVLDTDLTSDEARRPKLWFGVFGLLAYGVPALLMLLQLTIDNVWNVGADQHCYLQKPFHLYLWYLPVILAVGANILLFVAVLIRFRNSMRTFSVPLRMCLFPLVMGVTWGLNIITACSCCCCCCFGVVIWSHGLSEVLPVEEVPGWLVVLQSFLITGQGAWDCIIYSSTNGRFRHFYTKRVLRTVVLFVFGPLLVVPLLLRRALLYFSRRCLCCAPDALAPAAPHSSSASGSEGELLLRESFFPLSRSFSHPVNHLFWKRSC